MDKSAIDTPSREVDLRNIPVHLRTALRRALEFEARAPAPTSAEEAEQCEEQLRAIADEFFGALLTPVLQRAVRSAAVGDAASALVRHLPRRMRSDGLETVNVRTSRGTTVPVTTPYYREKHARRAKRRPGLYPIGANLFSQRGRRILACGCMTRRAGTVDEDWDVLLSFLPQDWRELAQDTGALKGCARTRRSTTSCGPSCCTSAADTRCGKRWFAPGRRIWRTCPTWHC